MGAADVAKLLGCNPSYVSLLEGGRRLPSLRLAARIERLTRRWARGPIMAADWISAGESEAA